VALARQAWVERVQRAGFVAAAGPSNFTSNRALSAS
jgi:hypothetical protein